MSLSRRWNKMRRSPQGEPAVPAVADPMKTSVTISAYSLDKEVYKLCCNRYSHCFDPGAEQRIVRAVQEANLLADLARHVLIYLDGDDGDLRVGAAELLGAITPLSMAEEVIPALQRHLSDGYMRDYSTGGFLSDEEDMRTVCECAEQSIRLISQALEPPADLPQETPPAGLVGRLLRLLGPRGPKPSEPKIIRGRDARIV